MKKIDPVRGNALPDAAPLTLAQIQAQATSSLLRSMSDEAWSFQLQKRSGLLTPDPAPDAGAPIMPATALGSAELYSGLRGSLNGMKQGRIPSYQYRGVGRDPRWNK
jgi:hypothetical protein